MKTILVTGGYGFIGSCFVLKTIAQGSKIINIDNLSYCANLKNLSDVENSPNYRFIKGDICDKNLLKSIFANNKIDAVINFAAESHVDNSISGPEIFIQTNIVGTFSLLSTSLEYYKKTGDKNFRFLHISTDEVFGDLKVDDPKFNEKTRYNPSSPYSASKAASDHLVHAWNRTYGLPIIITNCSNNFGPRQHREKLIPTIIAACLEGCDIPIYGSGKNIRDWIFVEDHCDGITLALNHGQIGSSYCFGGEYEITNIDIANMICEHLDQAKPRLDGKSYKQQITFVKDRLGHDFRYAIDNNLAKKELGFKITQSFKQRLKQTIDWYIL